MSNTRLKKKPLRRKEGFSVSLSPSLVKQARSAATRTGKNFSEFVAEAITDKLEGGTE